MQFIHLNGYGRTPGRGREPHETIEGVTAEAARVPGNAPHVRYPQEPRILYGTSPTKAGLMALQLSGLARNRVGRRLKSDGVTLIGGVATYPLPIADMGGFESDGDVYCLWVRLTLEWLQREHRESLVSVVEHTDEGHLHLHFFILPQLRPDGRLDFDLAHAGRKALNAAVERGVQPAAQQAAYVRAMMDYQDRYHRDVSAFFRHDRLGPRRKRVDRARYKVHRQAEADLSRFKAELELEYWGRVGAAEAHQRSLLVSKIDFIAVAAERERQLLEEIDRLRERIRNNGIDEINDPVTSTQPASGTGMSEELAMLDELEIFPTTPEPDKLTTDLWTSYRLASDAKIDQCASRFQQPEAPEPPKSPARPP